MKHPSPPFSPRARWAGMGRSARIGLGFGLVALVAIAVVMAARDTLRNSPIADLLNATLNLVPLLAAAIGAYVAPARKMAAGMTSGVLSLLPSTLLALLALGWIAPLIAPVLLIALFMMSINIAIGAALGVGLSRLVMAWRARSPRPSH